MSIKKFDDYPYPLTIVKDRYCGVYSGGGFTAWNCIPELVPEEITDDDVTCAEFWSDVMNGVYDYYCPPFGVGGTTEEAVDDLIRKLHRD